MSGRVRRSVRVPGGNEITVGELRRLLADDSIPDAAAVRTMAKAGKDPDITLWWDEDVP